MMKTFNTLCEHTYLFEGELDESIRSGKIDKKSNSYKKYIYLIKLKRLDNDNTYVYRYIKYNVLFNDIIILYLLQRYLARNLLREEIKQTLVIFDSSLIKSVTTYEGINLSEKEVIERVKSIDLTTDIKKVFAIYEWLLYSNFSCDIDFMSKLISLDLIGGYYDFMYVIFYSLNVLNEDLDKDWFNTIAENLFNPVDYCLFICSDLEAFISKLKEKNISINQGPKNMRGLVCEMDSYLCTLDADIRNTMFYHHRHHYQRQAFIKNFDLIPRNRFSYKNIHMSLGSVRWFSSNRTINNKTEVTNSLNSRQDLFLENYNIIKSLLENKDLSLYELQRNIELFLENQEQRFSNEKKAESHLRFNGKNFEFLNSKKLDIKMSISQANVDQLKDNKVIVWVKRFVGTLGEEKISELLLCFFIEIVSKESIEDEEDTHTPGIPAVYGFEKLGQKLVNKYIYSEYIEHLKKDHANKISLSLYKNIMKEEFKDFEDVTFNGRLGGYFVSYLINFNMLYQILDIKPDNPKETGYYLRVDKDIRHMFMKEGCLLHTPQSLPMVCVPKDFVFSTDPAKNVLGGYLLNDINYTNLLIKDKVGYEINTELTEDNLIIDLINGMSKTPYKINKDVLDYVILHGYDKNILTDQSNKKIQSFIKNPYKAYSKQDKNELRSTYSKILLEKNIINIANCYVNIEKLYFPVRLDQRTRIYCDTDYFDYQKSDLAKGLVLFVEPGKILKSELEVINYFKGYGANMFGLDKKSISFKVKWIDSNKDWILDFKNNDAVDKSENKACFLAFCFEFERFMVFMDDPEATVFYTYLPIQLDASCNGYQHLALLTRETEMFDKLNLSKSTPRDPPQDFYTYLKDKINSFISDKIDILIAIENKTNKELVLLESLLRLQKMSFDRSILKQSFMTNSYNASHPRLVENIVSNLKEKKLWDNDLIKRKDVSNYVICLKTALDLTAPKIKELRIYLDIIAKICTKLDMPIPWRLPHGALVNESYMETKKLRLQNFSFLKPKYTFYQFLKGEYSLRQQKRSTMPNLIHSLDASTIALLYKEYQNRLYTIHDCFATTADLVPLLIDTLKSTYLKLYSDEDYLLEFDDVVKTNINNKWGEGVFDLKNNCVYIPSKKKRGKPEMIDYPDINKVLKIKGFEKQEINNLVNSAYIII